MNRIELILFVFAGCSLVAMEELKVPQVVDIFDAAKQGNVTKIQEFLDAGASVNSVSWHGFTPLMYAAFSENAEAVALLLKKGAEVKRGPNQSSSLHFVKNNEEIFELLLKAGGKSLIDHKNFYGITPLMIASLNGHVKIVEKLLDAGAQIDLKDSSGRTALLYAIIHGKLEVVKKLILAGANIYAVHTEKASVCYRAGHIKVGAFLEDLLQDLQMLRDSIDKKADEDVLKLIEKNRFVANSPFDMKGNTALSYLAIQKKNKNLMAKTPDPEVKHKNGETDVLVEMSAILKEGAF